MTTQGRYAFAFYTTDDTYAIAVIVFIHRLQRLGVPDNTDIVVLHLPLSGRLLRIMRDMGVITRQVTAPGSLRHAYYRNCLVKLRIFELVEYERVVYVDADAIPLKRLDSLFTHPFNEPVAAAMAYWLPQPFWSSFLLVIKPSADLWTRVREHIEQVSEREHYDMDIVNAVFGAGISALPPEFACLDSEWEDRQRQGIFNDPDAAHANVSVVHFTALAKPWSCAPARARRLRPDAHPDFYRLRETWWQSRREAFRGGPMQTGINAVVLGYLYRRDRLRQFMHKVGKRLGNAWKSNPLYSRMEVTMLFRTRLTRLRSILQKRRP